MILDAKLIKSVMMQAIISFGVQFIAKAEIRHPNAVLAMKVNPRSFKVILNGISTVLSITQLFLKSNQRYECLEESCCAKHEMISCLI